MKAGTLDLRLSVGGVHPAVADRLRQSLMCDVTQESIPVPIPFSTFILSFATSGICHLLLMLG